MDPLPKLTAARRMLTYYVESDGRPDGYARFEQRAGDSVARLYRVPDGVIPDSPRLPTPAKLQPMFDRVAHPRKDPAPKRRRIAPVPRPPLPPPPPPPPSLASRTNSVIDLTCDEVIDLTTP